MRRAVLFVLITAGCSFDDVNEVEVRDAAFAEPDAGAAQDAAGGPRPEAGVATRPYDATPGPMPGPGASAPLDAAAGSMAPATDAAGPRPADDSMPSTDSVPATSMRCTPGRYQGPFTGGNRSLLRPLTISGMLTIELTQIPGQDRLAVAGNLAGYGEINDLIPESFELVGEVRAVLNCATHQLEDGHLVNASGSTEIIVGTVVGTYSDSPPSFSGTWMTNELLSASAGNWSAAAAPP